MKRIIKIMTFLIIFSVVTPLTFSLSESQKTAIIDQIRKDYNKTNENEKNYKVRSVKIKKSHGTTYYSVGDSVRYYTKNGEIRSNENGFEELGADIMEEFYEIKNLK